MQDERLTIITLEDESTRDNAPNHARFRRALDAAVSAAGGSEHVTLLLDTLDVSSRLPLEGKLSPKETDEVSSPILFAISLPADGINDALNRFLRTLRGNPHLLDNIVGAVLVDGAGSLYTKSVAAQLVFAANSAGCAFIGRPLVEATGDLSNFHVIADNLGTDLEGAYLESVRDLVMRLTQCCAIGHIRSAAIVSRPTGEPSAERISRCAAGLKRRNETAPRLLALHASSHETSNTLALWHATRDRLSGIDTREISLRNGELADCSGCSFEMCLHYGEQDSCFYGGVMVEEVYPALREADAILMVCPNYNDAIGANLTAFINRLTAMYRAHPFTDKALFAIIVSGYSGSDMLAAQLIAALNMNKSFYLPPRFALIATAHHPGTALRIPGIETQIAAFAEGIQKTLL